MDKRLMVDLYRKMVILRRVDEMLFELKMKDLVMNGFYPYSGEEAVAVGVCANLMPDDAVVSTHRPQGHSLAKGSSPRQIFAEMLGRRGGVSEGIGGPMQWIDLPNNFYCGSIVGSGMTIAAGVGLAMSREGRGRVCVSFFGDGASNTGSFHEALNLAGDLEVAGPVHLREQPIRRGHARARVRLLPPNIKAGTRIWSRGNYRRWK